MIKMTGVLLIMSACLWWGMYFAMKERYRLRELEELEQAMLYLNGQIQYLSAPLGEAFESIGWKLNGTLGQIFQESAERLSQEEEGTAEAVWEEIWRKEAAHTFLTAEDLDAVLFFGRSMGYLDKQRQEESIRLLLRYIEGALLQGRKRLEKNGRLYYGMGCLSGLLLIVTLL